MCAIWPWLRLSGSRRRAIIPSLHVEKSYAIQPVSQSVSAKPKPSLNLNLTLILTLTLTLILLGLTPLNPTNSNSNSKTMKFISFRRKSPQHPPQTTPCFQGCCRPTSGTILIIHQVALGVTDVPTSTAFHVRFPACMLVLQRVHEKRPPPKYNGVVFEILGKHH